MVREGEVRVQRYIDDFRCSAKLDERVFVECKSGGRRDW